MRISHLALGALIICALALTACDQTITGADSPTVTPVNFSATPVQVNATPPPLPVASEVYCKDAGQVTAAPNEPLAAKVNGQPVPLALYQRQIAQAQAALVAQGLDPNSNTGKDAIKGMQRQVLGQLIDDVLIEQAARQENVSVAASDVNNRIQQMINDAGARTKFDEYLKTNQLEMSDLCMQIRAALFGELMLNRVTAALPAQEEQVHATHILLTSLADANKVLAELKAGKDFVALAKQYSKDEVTRDNGGDLGWFPKGVMAPEFEAAVFQLKAGQVSGVVTTPLGFHIVKVLEREPARALSGELLQLKKQQAFLAWLQARRDKAQIEKLINP